ncbi:MAG TPA: hypothetical protein VFC82_11840 [Actinomycetaceae bacterium]|nr:hypothetical protein [Actinomycetaceae bacterium]
MDERESIRREIAQVTSSEEFRIGKGVVGGMITLCGLVALVRGKGGIKRMLLGGVLVGTAVADLCPANALIGYPIRGSEARGLAGRS